MALTLEHLDGMIGLVNDVGRYREVVKAIGVPVSVEQNVAFYTLAKVIQDERNALLKAKTEAEKAAAESKKVE